MKKTFRNKLEDLAINILKKITSRKFLAMAFGSVMLILTELEVINLSQEQYALLITSIVTYVAAQGYVDSKITQQ